jgi:hypothetical protein
MNRKRLLLAAEILLDHAEDRRAIDGELIFDMMDYTNPCGAPACVLGHVAMYDPHAPFELRQGPLDSKPWLYLKGENFRLDYDSVTVSTYYGITHHEAFWLFNGDGCGGAGTAAEAAAFIREFVETNGGNVPPELEDEDDGEEEEEDEEEEGY